MPRRDAPLTQFNFVVDLGDGSAEAPHAGFQECSALGLRIDVAEFRDGASSDGHVRKVTDLNKATDVTLERGAMASARLHAWLAAIRNGDPAASKTVRISLHGEDHATVVAAWVLTGARIQTYVPGPIDDERTDVAIEQLTLVCERLEIEDAG